MPPPLVRQLFAFDHDTPKHYLQLIKQPQAQRKPLFLMVSSEQALVEHSQFHSSVVSHLNLKLFPRLRQLRSVPLATLHLLTLLQNLKWIQLVFRLGLILPHRCFLTLGSLLFLLMDLQTFLYLLDALEYKLAKFRLVLHLDLLSVVVKKFLLQKW